MKVLDIYKRLPRTNCGTCSQRQCMAFAVSLSKGDCNASECPHLTDEDEQALTASAGSGDWRVSLIRDLQAEVMQLDISARAKGLGAELRGDSVSIRCLGRDFLVGPDGTVTTRGHLTPWMQILLLHYLRTGGNAGLSGGWVSFAELKSGMIKATSFSRECEEPLRACFDRSPLETGQALSCMEAEPRADMPAPVAWKLFALPRIPVMVLYWPHDDEFPSKLKILFNATADRYLDVESLMFLLEGLVRNVATALSRVTQA